MASNTSSGWKLKQAMFQSAVDGEEVRKYLVTCIDMLKASHDLRVNDTITSKRTSYAIRNTNTTKSNYECTITVTMTFVDEVEGTEIPMEKDYVFKYSDVNGKSKKKNINDRMTIYYNSGEWVLEMLKDSNNGYTKGYKLKWGADWTEDPIATITFDADVVT